MFLGLDENGEILKGPVTLFKHPDLIKTRLGVQ